MLTVNDHTDLGMLITFAIQPTQRPGRAPEYRRVLNRYRTEVDFRSATDAVLHGMCARALSDGDFGLILGVEPESPFAFRYSDIPSVTTRERRLVVGMVLIGLAAYAYPSPADLEDDRIRHVADVDFEAWLRSACTRLQVRDAGGEVIPEQGLDEAWRAYTAMPSISVGERGRGAGRPSPSCTLYWVRNVLGWMVDQGMARQDTTAAEPTWSLTERFRIHVKDMGAERAYTYLAQVGHANPGTPGAPNSGPAQAPSKPSTGAGDDERTGTL